MTEQKNAIVTLKEYGNNPAVKKRFEEVLKNRAPQFLASIINACNTNYSLQKCEPSSVYGAGMVAAALDLPIDNNLGFAAIVPYGTKAQFQMMWKGFVQLAIRSGQYKNLGVNSIYEDEVKTFDPITGDLELTPVDQRKQRDNGDEKKIVGYYAWFELASGFKKTMYMTVKQVENHAKKYSSAYKSGRTDTPWVSMFDSMAQKTVLKLLLSKFGILSIEMQKAITSDQAVLKEDGSIDAYIDHDAKKEPAKPVVED